jgi:hypothetical protein
MDRPSVYVATHDARRSDAFSREQVKQRRQRVATGVSLVQVFAHEELRCKKLRTLQHEEDAPVFQDLYGAPYKYTDGYTRADGTVVSAYFSRRSGEGDGLSQATAAVSHKHEEAVAIAGRLAMSNHLKVVTLCTYSGHAALHVAPSWVPHEHYNACVDAVAVDGRGQGRTVQVGYRWYPTPGRSTNFVLDLAVLREGVLSVAVHVQHSLAISSELAQALSDHGISSVQIKAEELVRACLCRDWATATSDVVVHHHPQTERLCWECPPCVALHQRVKIELETQKRIEANRLAALKRLEATKKRKRAEYEAGKLTTFANPEPGKYLKGFVAIPPSNPHSYDSDDGYSRPKEWHLAFFRQHPYYDPRPYMVQLKLLVHYTQYMDVEALEGRPSCLRLSSVKPDRTNPTQKVVFLGAKGTFPLTLGHELPGYVERLV